MRTTDKGEGGKAMPDNEVQIHAYISRALKQKLDVCSVAQGVSVTFLIRMALENLLTPDKVDDALKRIQEHLSAHRAKERESGGKSE